MTSRRTRWLLAASSWVLFGLFSGVQVWLSMRTHGHSVPRLMGFYLLVWVPWIFPNALTAKLEASLAEARLYALELQIQPHFLFNTMNAITSLVRTGRNDEAVAMIAGLSELLRYTLDHAGHQRVKLDDELSVLERYLEIQRFRFPDRMAFRIDASAEARRGTVPTLILQPLAENAVRHGIAPSATPGVVEVCAFRAEDRLRIEVFNSGAMVASAPRGIGLSNTLERLRHLYGDGCTFDLAGARGGVLASLSIPFSEST